MRRPYYKTNTNRPSNVALARRFALREKIRNRRVRFKLDVLALLSPEQKAQFREFVKSKKDRPGKGHGNRGRCWRDDNY
jgi:Spy/CpxP family protein refolding chaperone